MSQSLDDVKRSKAIKNALIDKVSSLFREYSYGYRQDQDTKLLFNTATEYVKILDKRIKDFDRPDRLAKPDTPRQMDRKGVEIEENKLKKHKKSLEDLITQFKAEYDVY